VDRLRAILLLRSGLALFLFGVGVVLLASGSVGSSASARSRAFCASSTRPCRR